MDLSGISWEKLIQYSIIAGMMNVDGSVFREKLRTAGIHCDASASVMMEAEKPFFVFRNDRQQSEGCRTVPAGVG